MNILQVFRAPIGGLFKHVCELSAELRQMGHSVGVVFAEHVRPEDSTPVLDPQIFNLGVWQVPMTQTPGISDWSTLKLLSQIVTKKNIDLVHGHGAKGGGIVRLARLLDPVQFPPTVYTPHGGALHFSPFTLRGLVFWVFEMVLQAHTSAMIFESRFAQRVYKSRFGGTPSRMFLVYNGIELKGEQHLPKSNSLPTNVSFIGELRKIKGLETLLEAALLLQQKRPEVVINLYGSGPDQEKFWRFGEELGLRNISWRGRISSPDTVLASSDCVVVPSIAESLPYVVIEALGAGVSVVASNVGGIPEIFGDSADLVEPENSVQLAVGIMRALDGIGSSIPRRVALAERIRVKFGLRRMAMEVQSVYRECTDAHQIQVRTCI